MAESQSGWLWIGIPIAALMFGFIVPGPAGKGMVEFGVSKALEKGYELFLADREKTRSEAEALRRDREAQRTHEAEMLRRAHEHDKELAQLRARQAEAERDAAVAKAKKVEFGDNLGPVRSQATSRGLYRGDRQLDAMLRKEAIDRELGRLYRGDRTLQRLIQQGEL